MRRPWFVKRTPEQGVGYNIGSREGLIATVAFVAVTAATAFGAILLLGESEIGATVSMVLVLGLALGFLAFVRRHSDDPNL